MFKTIKNSIKESTEYKRFVAVLSSLFEWIYTKFCFGIFSRFERKFVKYLFVGAMNTVVSYLIYAFFATITDKATLALTLSYILGILFNFQTTGKIVFKNKDNTLIVKFFLCYFITYFINRYSLEYLVGTMNVNKYLSQAILVFPIALISFFLLKHLVFKEQN